MTITQQQYEDAARAVLLALRERRGTSNRRLHVDRYKKHAAPVLGVSAVYPKRWAEVLDAGRRLGLFKIDRKTLQKPFLVDLGVDIRPSSYTAAQANPAPAPAIVDDVHDEDTSDDPTVDAGVAVSDPVEQSAAVEHTHGIVMIRRVSGSWLPVSQPRKITDQRLQEDYKRWAVHSDVVIAYYTEPAR